MASRAAPVPGPMAGPGTREAMGGQGTREAMVGSGDSGGMAAMRPRPQPPPRPLQQSPSTPPKKKSLGEVGA